MTRRKRQRQSDCNLLLGDVESLFGSLGNCLGGAFDEKKSKMDVAKGAFGFGKNLLKFGFNGTKCVIRHIPKAIVTVANAKRELTDYITNEYQKFQKEQREQALEEKIKLLKGKQE